MIVDVKKIRKDSYNTDEEVIVPQADISITNDEYLLTADMPGVRKEELSITLRDNLLEINGRVDEGAKKRDDLKYREFTLYNYYRSFEVGNDIDSDKISAAMENGVLTIRLPKKPEVKPRRITVNAG